MNYKYRVTLEGLKGFFRLYIVNSENTLYTFHKQLRSDLEFPVDQPILFKAFDAEGNVVARYALVDLGAGTVDMVSIANTVKSGIVKFVYFYDTKSKKSVNITLEGESEIGFLLPTIIETKGPLPIDFENGYVAFEDLPQDRRPGAKCSSKDELDCNEGFDDDEDFEDEDEDEEEDDDFKGEEVYDGDE